MGKLLMHHVKFLMVFGFWFLVFGWPLIGFKIG